MKDGETIGYLWEIDMSSTELNPLEPVTESLKLNFQTKYSSAEKPNCSQSLNYAFTINNYKVKLKYKLINLNICSW